MLKNKNIYIYNTYSTPDTYGGVSNGGGSDLV